MSERVATTGFTESEHRAIERFLTARTVPLCYQSGGRAFVQGTGTFYRNEDELFLVTAAHVLQGIDASLLGVPDRPHGSVSVWNLNDVTIHHPKNIEDFDIAVIELNNPNFKARVASEWQCVTESEAALPIDESRDFLISGYPTETVKDQDGTLTPAPMLQLFTKKYVGNIDPPVPEYDLLLKYSRSATDIFGAQRKTPALQGVSGAVVYAASQSTTTVWSPETVFRPVGIQVSMKHDEYVRVKRWSLVSRLLQVIREQRGGAC
jgi:Trypsin